MTFLRSKISSSQITPIENSLKAQCISITWGQEIYKLFSQVSETPTANEFVGNIIRNDDDDDDVHCSLSISVKNRDCKLAPK